MSTEKLHTTGSDDHSTVFVHPAIATHLKHPIPIPPLGGFDTSISLDPHQWSSWRKWTNVFLVACQATMSPICSTLVAVGADQVDREFNVTNSAVSALPVALFVVGLGLGPLYLAPLSEIYGRRIVYIVSFCLFSLFNVGGALVRDEVGFIILRFLAGLAGRSFISYYCVK